MIKDVYILHHNSDTSKRYLQDCIVSLRPYPDINIIPFSGPSGENCVDLCRDMGISIIPFYMERFKSGDSRELNNAFSCSIGHFRIWKEIVKSGRPGVILEHDAIVKHDLTTLYPIDGEILWLGPRVHDMDDYNYPEGWETRYVEVDRWEGTHAYAITPLTASLLLDYINEFGINDSIDGQLGMRNMFDMPMRAVDPPHVVAVVSGNRKSTIENSGNAATWNAYSTDGFRAGLKGIEPPVRQLHFTNNKFMRHTGILDMLFKGHGFYENKPLKVLVLGGEEGMSTLWLSNKLLRHDDSQLFCTGGFERQNWELFNYNTYFSKYYYKLNSIYTYDATDIMVASCDDPDIIFDVVYIGGNTTTKDTIFNGVTALKMMRNNGMMIFDNYDNDIVKKGVNAINKVTWLNLIHDGNFAVMKY